MKPTKSDLAELSALMRRLVQVANRGTSVRYDMVRFGVLQLSAVQKNIRPSELALALDGTRVTAESSDVPNRD